VRNSPWDEARAQAIVDDRRALPGATLPMLHALQEAFGYVPDEAIPLVMDSLNLSRAEVVGVIEFYHDFRRTPGGEHVLLLCRAESCQSMGSEALAAHVSQRAGIAPGETTAGGELSVETVYCLGNCALSPALMFDGRLHGRATTALADRLVAEAGA
jgi:formate dehydrogenase subunit gamma